MGLKGKKTASLAFAVIALAPQSDRGYLFVCLFLMEKDCYLLSISLAYSFSSFPTRNRAEGKVLETVGVFEVPKQNGKYETGQVGIMQGQLSLSWDILFLSGAKFCHNTESQWHFFFLFIPCSLPHSARDGCCI